LSADSDRTEPDGARSKVYQLADRYVERYSVLDPVGATFRGIPGHDGEMTDYSPAGIAARGQLDHQTLTELRSLPSHSLEERIAADVMGERLQVAQDQYQIGERLRDLRVIASPVQHIRQCFDLMPTGTRADWETIATRLHKVPTAVTSLQATLREAMRQGIVVARRQVLACARQATIWSGGHPDTPSFFSNLVRKYQRVGSPDGVLQHALEEGASRATEAYAGLARFLTEEYAPNASEHEGAGSERYRLLAQGFTGMKLDLEDTYRWGWDELHRIEDEMRKIASRILPGEPLPAVMHLLETDPKRAIEGVEPFRQWLQDLMDRTMAQLDGKHFDIPTPVKRVEAMIAPPGGTAAMYYTRPTEDFSRPGRTWYPTLGKTRFPLWGEVSTAYHEGVPGHHLQLAHVVYLKDHLSRFQRSAAHVPGNSEGWALYAERLMGELGYFDNPDYELGMLRAQAFRAMRVILDIGVHLELPISTDQPFHPGERWSPELMLPFAVEHGYHRPDFIGSEVERYLGFPGQAICYKVGERIWLAIREEGRRRTGPAFDLKAFHAQALNLGPMGLSQLQREFQRGEKR